MKQGFKRFYQTVMFVPLACELDTHFIRVFLQFDISYQIMAGSCQHWHSMGGDHCMSMLVRSCHDLAGNVKL